MYYFQELFKAKIWVFPKEGYLDAFFVYSFPKKKNGKCPKSARAGGWARLELNEWVKTAFIIQ